MLHAWGKYTSRAEIQKNVVKTHLRIDEFTPDSISIGAKNTLKADLDQIRK